MKVTITFEDVEADASEENDNVSVEFDFDPPMEETTAMTPAGFLASKVMESIQTHFGEELDDGDAERRIVVASH